MGLDDPMDPSVEGVVENPTINIHHWALPANNHTLLVIGDECGGAAAPACVGAQNVGPTTASTPTGAIWFYDISDPSTPVLQGYVSAPTETENPAPCTAHFGDVVGDREVLATGCYQPGRRPRRLLRSNDANDRRPGRPGSQRLGRPVHQRTPRHRQQRRR